MLLSCTTKTMVIGGTIEEVNGAPWDHDYVAIEPPNVITLDDIEWESSFIPKTPTITAPTVLKQWKIPSSDGLSSYTVSEYSDKSMTCECNGFKYRKTCKHLQTCKQLPSFATLLYSYTQSPNV